MNAYLNVSITSKLSKLTRSTHKIYVRSSSVGVYYKLSYFYPLSFPSYFANLIAVTLLHLL